MDYLVRNDNYYKFIAGAGLNKDNLKDFVKKFIEENDRHPTVSDIYPEYKI